MNQKEILNYIKKITDEEQQLYVKGDLSSSERKRKKEIDEELNQYWDLLRQRRALRNSGDNPDAAKLRSRNTVDKYDQ